MKNNMKTKIILPLLFLLSKTIFGQINLVPNGDFETTVDCANYTGLVGNCANWLCFSPSPDYLNTCLGSPWAPPATYYGYQSPHSGNGLLGNLIWYNQEPNGREYTGVQLTSPLVIGQKYYLSFYMNYAAYYSPNQTIAANKMGMRLSTIPVISTGIPSPLTTNFAHLKSNIIYKDTLNWLKVSGSIIADSSYNYVILGNFFDDAHTDTNLVAGFPVGALYSYYFIDDVCVSTDSTCSFATSVKNYSAIDMSPIVFPNPAESSITISNVDNYKYNLTITNLYGTMLVKNIVEENTTIDLTKFSEGIYFVSFERNGLITRKKLIVKH